MATGTIVFDRTTTGMLPLLAPWYLVIVVVDSIFASLPMKSENDAHQRCYKQPFFSGYVVRIVDLCCCYCFPTGGAVATAVADSRSYAALLSSSCLSPTIVQTHLLLLNNSGQATSRFNYIRQHGTSRCNDDGNNSNRKQSTCCCWNIRY
jgi:hypothetical protein